MIDRKIMLMAEEMPAHVKREYKALEMKEEQLIKDVGAKFTSIQEASIRLRDQLKQRQNELADQLQKMEMKGSEMDYRVT